MVGTDPPAGQEGKLNHGGLPTTGWGDVRRDEQNSLIVPAAGKK